MSTPKTSQCAAIPFRLVDGRPQVMLVTSRETRRWIIPKGWAKKKLEMHAMAAREAYEEAGVIGAVDSCPIGHYSYQKRMDDGQLVDCDVAVFLLNVERELPDWPERGERERLWMSPLQAANLVSEAEVGALLRGLAAPVVQAAS